MERPSIGRVVLKVGEEVGFVGGALVSMNGAISHDWVTAGVSAGVSIASKAVPVAFRRVTEIGVEKRARNQNKAR